MLLYCEMWTVGMNKCLFVIITNSTNSSDYQLLAKKTDCLRSVTDTNNKCEMSHNFLPDCVLVISWLHPLKTVESVPPESSKMTWFLTVEERNVSLELTESLCNNQHGCSQDRQLWCVLSWGELVKYLYLQMVVCITTGQGNFIT